MVKYEPRQPLGEVFRIELMQQFKPEVEQLSHLLNRDLTGLWGYDKL
jgi:hypothetical protein